jgi:Zn-finger nucleic acid-binding protein
VRLVHDRDYFVCEYCGSFDFPDESSDGVRVLGQPGSADCPVCKMGLVSACVGESHVLYCNNCKGILIPQSSFLNIIQYRRAKLVGRVHEPLPFNPAELARQIKCPYCHRAMDVHPYAGGGKAVIDLCARCAVIWLDYGEMSKIVCAPEYGSDSDV